MRGEAFAVRSAGWEVCRLHHAFMRQKAYVRTSTSRGKLQGMLRHGCVWVFVIRACGRHGKALLAVWGLRLGNR